MCVLDMGDLLSICLYLNILWHEGSNWQVPDKLLGFLFTERSSPYVVTEEVLHTSARPGPTIQNYVDINIQ